MSKTNYIKKYILNQVKLGFIKGGDRLPSIRKVSEEMKVNKITANKAYKELEDEHIIYCIPRSGYYLVNSQHSTASTDKKIDFASMLPDRNLIPHAKFKHAMNTAMDIYKRNLLQYNTPAGLASLRHQLKYTFENQGVYANLDQIIITNGAQQAIFLSIALLFKNGGILVAEKPTYDLFIKYVNQMNIDTVYIDRIEKGYDFIQLETTFKSPDVKAFYFISRYHNPTGYCLNEKDKLKVAELAHKYNVILIEDDYMADLASAPKSLPVYYYDIHDITIYIKSFSKSFMPGIRLGAAILPKALVQQFIEIKYLTDLNTSTLNQAGLEIFIKSGMYEKQVIKLKKLYSGKAKRAQEILSSLNLRNIDVKFKNNSLFIWMKISNDINAQEIQKRLKEKNIIIKSGKDFFPFKKDSNQTFIRICLSSVPIQDIHFLSAVIESLQSYAF